MVANNLFWSWSSFFTRERAAEFGLYSSSKSFGKREKYAISEPETKPEKTNKNNTATNSIEVIKSIEFRIEVITK